MNPLIRVGYNGPHRTLAEVAPLKSPIGFDSKAVYGSIVDNIEAWVEEAIQLRKRM